jgi:hypothetical protein
MIESLVILRCGRGSLHPHWLAGTNARDWDLVLCPYQEIADTAGSIIAQRIVPGQKWNGIHELLTTWQGWRDYDYIWLPDDDLLTDAATINALFAMSAALRTKISAPALSADSHYSYPMTMTNQSWFARAVSFIEIMMPCLRRDVLEETLPLLAASTSGYGWGLDFAWAQSVNHRDMVIFDRLTVRHARPVGALRDQAAIERALRDMHDILAATEATQMQRTLGAYDDERRYRPADNRGFLLDYLNGYRYLIARGEGLLKTLVAQQDPEIFTPVLPEVLTGPRRGENLALRKPALVSAVSAWSASQDPAVEAAGGNNGQITGACGFHTPLQREPWWQVDLGRIYAIRAVVVFNRLDFAERCIRMRVSSSPDGANWTIRGAKLDGALFGGADGNPYTFTFSPPFQARLVRITLIGEGMLHLDEIEVYGDESPPQLALSA